MIKISNLAKYFDDICAINHISFEIPEGVMFGLLGTNGAGKTTLLRILAGIIEADEGEVQIGNEEASVLSAKEKVFYLPDEPYYFPNASMQIMLEFYKKNYSEMDSDSVGYWAEKLNLDIHRPIRTFSKGMKRQAFLILALCSGTKYLLCDEVFDGLDPIVTKIMKNLFKTEMEERKFTIIVASHKLTDLEDICENIAILHKGGIVTAGDFKEKARGIYKFQCVFKPGFKPEDLNNHLSIVKCHIDYRFVTLIVKGNYEDIKKMLWDKQPVFINEVTMSLEEIFIAEMEEAGYDIKKVLC